MILGKNRSPKPPSSPQVVGNGNSREANAHREARWNVIPQLRRGLNRGYGAIRRPNNPQVCKVIDKCILLLKIIYSGNLNPELVLYLNYRKDVESRMVQYLNTAQPDHLNTVKIDAILFSVIYHEVLYTTSF